MVRPGGRWQFESSTGDGRVVDFDAVLVDVHPLVGETDKNLLARRIPSAATATASDSDWHDQSSVDVKGATTETGNATPGGDATPDDLSRNGGVDCHSRIGCISGNESIPRAGPCTYICPACRHTSPGRGACITIIRNHRQMIR